MVKKTANRVNVIYNSRYELPLKLHCLGLNTSISAFFQSQVSRFLDEKPFFEVQKGKTKYKRTTILLDKSLKTQLDVLCIERGITLFDVFNYLVRSVLKPEEL